MDGGAGPAVYIAREEPSIFKRLIWWSEQKIRQVSLLIRNRKPQSLQLWYTSHFPLALDFLSTLVIPPFLFVLYLIMRSRSKGSLSQQSRVVSCNGLFYSSGHLKNYSVLDS